METGIRCVISKPRPVVNTTKLTYSYKYIVNQPALHMVQNAASVHVAVGTTLEKFADPVITSHPHQIRYQH